MRPTFIRIDLDAINSNLAVARQCASASKVLACVKADAYGHGLVAVAKAISNSVDAFGVANLDEALELRNSDIETPILLLEGVFDSEELKQAIANNLWITVHSHHQIAMLESCKQDKSVPVWLKMDSGMHRLGFSPSEYADVYRGIRRLPCVKDIVLMTHFARSDELDSDFTDRQIAKFDAATEALPGCQSLANSAAILAWKSAHRDWIRPGFMLYGASPFPPSEFDAMGLVPAMELLTEVIAVRDISVGEGIGYNHHWIAPQDSRIAVLAIGYGDGYPRNTKNGTPVIIGGQRARTVGHVAMDMMLVDVTGLAGVEVGSSAELWGKNLSINEVAASSGFSPYELMTRLTGRLLREQR